MDNKRILQVLHSALHPVVERSRSFGKLKVQLVDGFEKLLGSLLSIKNVININLQFLLIFKVYLGEIQEFLFFLADHSQSS